AERERGQRRRREALRAAHHHERVADVPQQRLHMKGLYFLSEVLTMARRGLTVLFTLLGMAVFFSIAAFVAMYVLFGREPAVAAHSTLVLQVGGDLAELAPADVFGYIRGNRTPTVRSVVDNLRKAKADARVSAVLLKPTNFSSPFWAKVQEVRDAVLEFRK